MPSKLGESRGHGGCVGPRMLRFVFVAALAVLLAPALVHAESVVFLEGAHGFRSRLVENGRVVDEREGLLVPSSQGLVELRVVAREETLPWCREGVNSHTQAPDPVAHLEHVVAMRADSPWLTVVAEKEPTEGEFEARTRLLGVLGSRVFLAVHTASSSCGAHPDWSTEFVVFDVETMAPVDLEHDADVQRWAQRHIPERTCEEGCSCDPFTSLALYPRFIAAGELRATGVYLWREESYVCTSGEWGAYFSSVPVSAAAPAAWVRAYQPHMADARIAMEGQRGRLLGATSVSARRDELRAAFARRGATSR